MSTPTTSRTRGASAKASAPVPVPESSARSSPLGATKRAILGSSSAAWASWCSPIRSAVLPNRSRVASCIVERLLLRGDRTRRSFFRDLLQQAADLRAGRETQLVEPPVAAGREAAQLGEDPLAGRPRDQGGALAHQPLGARVQPHVQLVLEPDRAEQTERVVLEDRVADRAQAAGAEVLLAAERV